jgi:clostripain
MSNLILQVSQQRMWLSWIGGLLLVVGLACGGVEVTVVTPTARSQPAAPTQPVVSQPPTATRRSAQPNAATVQATAPTQEPGNSAIPEGQATNQQPASQGGAEWTIMLYQDADDEILEQDIMIDFNEAELVGSSGQVNIVAQVDRYRGAYKGMGNWTGAKRFYLTPDRNLREIGSEEVADLGEVNMADGETLVDFITWAVTNYPARKYALIMSDHGAGWPGGWNDPAPGGLGRDRVVVAQLFGVDGIWLMELDRALEKARRQTGLDKFDLIGFDACLMGQLEVFTALEPHARYAVASQEVEPALGWAYAGFLTELVQKPGMDGAELARLVVESYIDYDLRILDNESRRELVAQEFNFRGETTSEEVAEVKGRDVTLTAVDLTAMPQVNAAVDNLATALAQVNPKAAAQARAYAQAFQSIFGEETPSPYIDLGHFAQLATELSHDGGVADAAEQVFVALKQTILAEKHGSNRPGSTGLTIYFPTGQIYGTADNFGYTTVAERFAQTSKWDDYLYFFHTGKAAPENYNRPRPEAEPVSGQTGSQPPAGISPADWEIIQNDIASLENAGFGPQEIPLLLVMQYGYPLEVVQYLMDDGVFRGGGASRALPAAGLKPIQLAPLTLSAEVATITAPVTIQTEVSGDRLAYVYSFIGRFLPREDALLIEDIDYLSAEESQTIGGVAYPVWPQGGVEIEFEWEPLVYAISDGTTSVKALFEPVAYDPETPTYAVGGTYRFASGGEPRYAKMYFRDDAMTEVFGFTSGITQAVGAPRQIVPQPGDQFTVLERGDDLSLSGNEGREKYVREGGTLTFGETPFTLETTPAPSGNYVIGVIAEDLDGRKYEQYEGLFVLNEEAAAVDGFKPYVNEVLEFALLYPELWQVGAGPGGSVNFADAANSALVTVSRRSYPDASSPAQANSQAVQDVIDALSQNGDFENLQFLGDVQDYVLGAYDAQTIDFAYDLNGQPYYGYVVASTPVEGTTYVVRVSALDAKFDELSAEFDDILYSFDILLSGVSKEQAGPPPPALAGEVFADDFSDPAGGLINDEAEQEWGRGYYSPAGQYVFELKPAPGAIYDYYPEQDMPADFLLQTTASYSGAVDNAYGLIFRVQAGQEGDDFYAFCISGDGFYTVEKTEDQQMVPLIDWTASALIDSSAGGANVLTIEGQGDVYRFYINGRQVDALTDATYSGGTFGLMVDNYDEANPVTFTFDDLRMGSPEF